LGREYEREHGLKAGRQRLKQLIQLGKRYEVEHGLRVAKPQRRRRGDAWQEFLTALARVIKPAHRSAVEQLAVALRSNGRPTVEGKAA
jgi:heme oxygenase